jgi:hypothetical protein
MITPEVKRYTADHIRSCVLDTSGVYVDAADYDVLLEVTRECNRMHGDDYRKHCEELHEAKVVSKLYEVACERALRQRDEAMAALEAAKGATR